MPAQVISYIDIPGPDLSDRDLELSLGGRLTTAEATSVRSLGGALSSALADGNTSIAVQVLGDSTGNEVSEWPYLLAQDVAAAYPNYEVRAYMWDYATETMPRVPTVVQPPSETPRGVTFAGVGGSSRHFWNTSITGDLDVRIKYSNVTWADGIASCICCAFGSPGARGWRLYKHISGYINFDWTTDGTNLQAVVSPGAVVPSASGWLRVTLDVDNGAAGHTINIYTSSDGVTWTPMMMPIVRGGTTSLFNASTPFEIGARGYTAEPFNGRILEAHVLNGIDGYAMAPLIPEHWSAYSTGDVAPTGTPIFTVMNGSHTGAALAYLDGGTVLEKMTPNMGTRAVIISDSHNEAGRIGSVLYTSMAAYVTSIKARLPGVGILAVTQNPRTAPAANIAEQLQRRFDYMAWGSSLGWNAVDTYGAFLSDGRPLSDLVNPSDGIHPLPAGSALWKDTVKAALGLA